MTKLIDLDILFSHTTNRQVIVRSRSLGIIRSVGLFSIAIFFVYVRLYSEKRHLELSPVTGTFSTQMGPPDMEEKKIFSDLPYCLDNHSSERMGLGSKGRLACVNMPAQALNSLTIFKVFFPTMVGDNVAFDLDCYQGPEYLVGEEYEMCLDGPGGDQNYIANIESFKLHIQHAVIGKDGEHIRHISLESLAVECEDGMTIPVKKDILDQGHFDTIFVEDIVRCAGVNLDKQVFNSTQGSFRDRGVQVSMAIKYDSDLWGKINKYTYQFTHFKAQARLVVPDSFRAVKPFYDPWGARRRRRTTIARRLQNTSGNAKCKSWCIDSAAEKSWRGVCRWKGCEGCSQCAIDMHPLSADKFETYVGINVDVKQAGYSGKLSFYAFMVTWVSTIALINAITLFTDIMMTKVLPARNIYKEYKFLQTPDFRDFKGGRPEAVLGVNELIKANATYGGHEHYRKYNHDVDKSTTYHNYEQHFVSNEFIVSKISDVSTTGNSTVIGAVSDRNLPNENLESPPTDGKVEIFAEHMRELGKALEAMEVRFDSILVDIRAELAELRASQPTHQKESPDNTAQTVSILVEPDPSSESGASISQQIASNTIEERLWQLEASIGNLQQSWKSELQSTVQSLKEDITKVELPTNKIASDIEQLKRDVGCDVVATKEQTHSPNAYNMAEQLVTEHIKALETSWSQQVALLQNKYNARFALLEKSIQAGTTAPPLPPPPRHCADDWSIITCLSRDRARSAPPQSIIAQRDVAV